MNNNILNFIPMGWQLTIYPIRCLQFANEQQSILLGVYVLPID
jgi:hypothetical protein